MPARLIIAMLLTGGLAFSGALAVSSLAGDDDAPPSSGGVPPVPLNLESSTSQAESVERTAGLPTLAPRRRRPKPRPDTPSPPAVMVAPVTPSAPVQSAPSPPEIVAPPATPAPTPRPPTPEPPVDFLNSG